MKVEITVANLKTGKQVTTTREIGTAGQKSLFGKVVGQAVGYCWDGTIDDLLKVKPHFTITLGAL